MRRREAWRVVPFILYAVYSAARSDLRVDHFVFIVAVGALVLIGPRVRELLSGLYPFALVALMYDAMRPLQTVGLTESRVLLCGLRGVEARLFGDGTSTLQDYFVVHHTPALDLFSAFPYATFIAWSVVGAITMYFKDRPAMKRFAWGWFCLNVLGFITYHGLPAGPPWYFHAHGCVVDLATRPTEGPALMRVDAMLGIHFFHGMYARGSSVFGALPSLHCAYPLLLVIEGWRSFKPWMRAFAVFYWCAMVFAAVYLDHHWLIDAVVGGLYAVLVSFVLRRLPNLAFARARSQKAVTA